MKNYFTNLKKKLRALFKTGSPLSSEEKNKRIEAIYDGVKYEAEKVRCWLDKKKVVLTGDVDDIGNYNYIDNRTTEEKKSTTYNSSLPKAGRTWLQKLFGSE